MISIVDSQHSSDHLETYRQWISEEWGSDHSFNSREGSPSLPPSQLAIADERLAGGISFTWHAAPGSSEIALWINTVYVEPSYRSKGIASALIAAAEETARMTISVKALLVYTSIPDLYLKNDWVSLSQENGMWVLSKEL